MLRFGEARPPRLALARLAAAVAVAACCCFIDAASASSDDDSAGDSTLFACGSNGDASADTKQVIGVFDAVKSVCCDDFLEECDSSSTLPTTCRTAGCARVVHLLSQSCAAAFADGFLRVAFKPQLSPLVTACRTADEDPTPVYAITDPGLRAVATTHGMRTCHGRVVDGTGSGFSASGTGQDTVVLQAPAGLQMQITAESMHFSPHANVRVYDGTSIDAPQLGLLRGTSLPLHAQDREFVSSNRVLTLMRAVDLHDDAGLPLMFSLRIACVCTDDGSADSCGTHGSCANGLCTCDEGYGGGMCDTIVDACKAPVHVDCGAHGSCVDGRCECDSGAYTGDHCEMFDPCFGNDCHGHGVCEHGTCTCDDGFHGPTCNLACKSVAICVHSKTCCSACGGCSNGRNRCGSCSGCYANQGPSYGSGCGCDSSC